MAAIEQKIKGQIGQPAACMIENNRDPPLNVLRFRVGDYGPKRLADRISESGIDADFTWRVRERRKCHRQSTAAVDNFVGNHFSHLAEARKCWPRDRLLKDEA